MKVRREGKLTLQSRRLALTRFTSTLEGVPIQEIQEDTIRQFLTILIGKTGSAEFRQVVPLNHVTSSGVCGSWRKNQESILVDAHGAALPEKRVGELDVDFADFDRAEGWLVGGGMIIHSCKSSIFFLYGRGQGTDDAAARSGSNG